MPQKDTKPNLRQVVQKLQELTATAVRLQQELEECEQGAEIYYSAITLGSGEYPCGAGETLVTSDLNHKKSATELKVISREEFTQMVAALENNLIRKKLGWRGTELFAFLAPPRAKVLAELQTEKEYAATRFPRPLFVVKKEYLTNNYGVVTAPFGLKLRPLEKTYLMKRFMELNHQIRRLSGADFYDEFYAEVAATAEFPPSFNYTTENVLTKKLGVPDPCYCLPTDSFYLIDYAQLQKDLKSLEEYFTTAAAKTPAPKANSPDKKQVREL